MGFFHNLKLQYRPPRKSDPEFGEMIFMYMPKSAPGKSYWEATIYLPQLATRVEISLEGGEEGPAEISKEFYRKLIPKFDAIITAARPLLAKEYLQWMDEEIPEDIFSVLTPPGFGVEDPAEVPAKWDMMFETKGEKWRAISVYFEGDKPVRSEVDT